jgi:hypothetical protein
MNNIKYKSIEIVGTDMGSDGRSCGLHPVCCGEDVLVDTKLKLFKATFKRKITRTINRGGGDLGLGLGYIGSDYFYAFVFDVIHFCKMKKSERALILKRPIYI